jgi:hypothetical protein
VGGENITFTFLAIEVKKKLEIATYISYNIKAATEISMPLTLK